MKHIKDLANPNVDRVLIYAGDHGYYWRKGWCGYTTANDAGVFTRAEAYELAGHCGPEKHVELHDVPEDHLPTLKEQIGMIREYNDALREERDRLAAAAAKDREWLGRALDKQAEYLRQCGQLVEERDTLRAEVDRLTDLFMQVEGIQPDGELGMSATKVQQWYDDSQNLMTLNAEAARLREALEESHRHLQSIGWTVNRVQSALTFTTTTAEWLAARDEEQRRLGAAEELEKVRTGWLSANEYKPGIPEIWRYISDRAARLRARKG